MARDLRRRTFLAASGGTLLAPRSGFAQDRVRRVAVLLALSEKDPEAQARLGGLRDGLARLGWIEGRNLQLEVKFGAGDARRMRAQINEFVRTSPDIIVVNSTPALDEAHAATRTIPVIFILAVDPVELGYIQSLARPGGNITGFPYWDVTLIGKWLQLLKEVSPEIERATFIHNPATTPFYPALLKVADNLARSHGITLARVEVREAGEIEPAIRAIAREPRASLVNGSDPFLFENRKVIADTAIASRLPLISIYRAFADAGALMTYGPDTVNLYREGAGYVARVLKGANPGELPAQAPTKYEFVLNGGTAARLGLAFPTEMLAVADQVID